MFVCLGAKIDWVQCDGCELWYHLKCVGLTPDQCTDDDDYHCPACTRHSSLPARQPTKLPASAAKRKTPKRLEAVDPPEVKPERKSKVSSAKMAVTSAAPVFGAVKPAAVVSSAVSSKDTPTQLVDSNPLRTVATGGFAAFARPGSFGNTKLFEFSTLAQNAVRRPGTICSASSSRDEPSGKSLSASGSSSFTVGQYLYTPWLAKNALAPR